MESGKTHLSTWISSEQKERFGAAAAGQGLSESALLKRLVEQMLSVLPEVPEPSSRRTGVRESRISVRLVPEDRLLLHERACGRRIPDATYVSILVRTHLRSVAPLPDRELQELRRAVHELSVLGRNLNAIARALQQGGSAPSPGRQELHAMLKIGEALRDHVRGLIRTNAVSWESGHAQAR
jgi:hypothetical protein